MHYVSIIFVFLIHFLTIQFVEAGSAFTTCPVRQAKSIMQKLEKEKKRGEKQEPPVVKEEPDNDDGSESEDDSEDDDEGDDD